MRRRLWGIVVLALLATTAGCMGPFGGNEVDEEALAEDASYDWDTTAATTLTIDQDAIHAVYSVENRSTLEVYAYRRFNNERPVDPVALRFRYPNGTVVGHEAMSVSKTNSRTVIELPASEGQVAMQLQKTGKQIRVPVVVEGSHEVVLPENTDVQYFLLGRVSPRADERVEGPDGQVHLRWDDLTAESLSVRYYLERDLLIFTAVVALASVLAIGGLVYFWLQLRSLRARRQQVAWEDGPGSP